MTMPSKMRVTSPEQFNSDDFKQPAVAIRVHLESEQSEHPQHSHRKGQLILMIQGSATCEVPQALWFVPPQHAVWIPGGTPHSSRASPDAQIYFLFIEPGAVRMPDHCCTLAITPLLRELIRHLAHGKPAYQRGSKTEKVVAVLLDQLAEAPVQQLHLPISQAPAIRRMLETLSADPSDRTTLSQWAARLAMSDRTLARLVVRETGLTFGRWRQQLHLIVALRQLADGTSVQQVAGLLGYDSVTAFITMFKKALGKSPTQYFASLRNRDPEAP
ncbi:AraC family transcriptional regulator [Burkholderia ambifaria]|uniref:AraC family transcriptional regulator n=2 Tax=Burkholderia ambifaria TaxID=152480 RepID=UPI00371C3F6B